MAALDRIARTARLRREAKRAADARAAPDDRAPQPGERLVDWMPRLVPEYTRPHQLEPFADLLERAPRGGIRAVVSCPPRWGKTELALVSTAFHLAQDPRLTFFYLSYGGRLSTSKSKRARRLARDAGVRISDDSSAAHEWLTPEGGGMRAAGIQQSVIGHGAHVIFVDDPHQNRHEAESLVLRDTVWETYTSVVESRLEPMGSIIIFMQRWHEDDLVGRALATGEFEHVNIPALDPVTGESTWPERWSTEAMLRRRRIVGEYDWQSQYCGVPVRRGGRLFQDATLTDVIPPTGREAFGCDFAYSVRTRSDWSVALRMRHIGDRDGLPVVAIVEVHRDQVQLADMKSGGEVVHSGFASRLASMSIRAPGVPIVTALGPNEVAILGVLEQVYGLRIEHTLARADKVSRTSPYQAAWNDGRVLIPRGAPWADAFISEHAGWSGHPTEHDDQIDAASNAYDRLAVGETRAPSSSGRRETASLGRGRWT